MKWIAAKIIFESDRMEIAKDLIADAFYDLGLQGVTIEEPSVEPVEGWGPEAVKPPDYSAVTGYFPLNESLDARRSSLEDRLRQLQGTIDLKYTVHYQALDEEDWAEAWKQFFWPEEITDRMVVKPTWRDYTKTSDDMIVIEIDPGMAFGTGTHPTTAMCLAAIQDLLKSGDTMLDIGTGSGILMVAAAKLGASRIRGVDNDEVAVAIARKNLERNAVDPVLFKVDTSDLAREVTEQFDVVVANILTETVLELLDHIRLVLKPGGILICSGIISDNAPKVREKLERLRYAEINLREKDQWVCFSAIQS